MLARLPHRRLENLNMSRSIAVRRLLVCSLFAAVLTGCSRDPNVRKQKYFDSGEKYFAQGKYREAEIQYRNAVQIDSRFAQAHYQLALTYLKLNDTNRAYEELGRTVDLNPDNYHARVDLANLLMTARNPDGSPVQEMMNQAKTQLDVLRDKQPNSPETHEAWANYYSAQNNLATAIQEAQQTVASDPGRSESYLLLALLEIRANQPDAAEVNFKKAVEVDPENAQAKLALGNYYQARNRLPEAEQEFREVVQSDPKDVAPRAALASLLMREGKKDEAEAFLRQTKKEIPDNPDAYRMLGDFYFANGDLDKALAEYASLSSDHPKELRVKKNYIQLLILKNRYDEAAKLNNDILKSNPHDVEALIYKGELQLHQGDANGAVESMQNALSNDPDNAVGHYQLGLALWQQRNPGQAEAEWREAVRLRPDLTDAHRMLTTVELSHRDFDGLYSTAQQIITQQPASADGYLLKGFADIAHQKYSAAQTDAEQARQRAPDSPAPYIQMGMIQLAEKSYTEAEKFYQQALDKDPSSSDALSGLMNTFIAEKQFDKAIAAANAQIAKSPNNSNFYDLLGTALFNGDKSLPAAQAAARRAKDLAASDAALEKAIALDKSNIDAVEKLGKVEVVEGSPDKAVALYQQGIKDNPREVGLYILCGELYESRKDWDHAKGMYQQALVVSPDNPIASNNLAYVMLEQGGNVDVALSMAQTARRALPDSANAADTLGWAYYQKGVYQSAIDQFQEALRLNEKAGAPDDSVMHYHLGLAYQKAKQLSLARQQLEKAVKLSPNNADARKALSELRS